MLGSVELAMTQTQEEAHDLRLIPFPVDLPLSDHDKERSERTTGTSGQSDI